jgi:hypothetical protein
MSKLEKISNMLIMAGAGLGLTSVFFKSFFYTVDAGIFNLFRGKSNFV